MTPVGAADDVRAELLAPPPGKTCAAVKRELRQRTRKPKPAAGDDSFQRLAVVKAARALKRQVAGTDLVPDDLRTGLVPLLDRIEQLHPEMIM